jgi:hypothetical protein
MLALLALCSSLAFAQPSPRPSVGPDDGQSYHRCLSGQFLPASRTCPLPSQQQQCLAQARATMQKCLVAPKAKLTRKK